MVSPGPEGPGAIFLGAVRPFGPSSVYKGNALEILFSLLKSKLFRENGSKYHLTGARQGLVNCRAAPELPHFWAFSALRVLRGWSEQRGDI